MIDNFANDGRLLALQDLKTLVDGTAESIRAPRDILPTFGSTADFGRPHIEVDWAYHWIVIERGQELERRTTGDLDELMYWIFSMVSFSLASDFELAHRAPDQDSRRILFAKKLEILGSIKPEWRARALEELRTVLADFPFTDGAPATLA